MSETLTISIRTLTPVWTGDVNGRCSEIKETGIIGSMRWWYEAIVRGWGDMRVTQLKIIKLNAVLITVSVMYARYLVLMG